MNSKGPTKNGEEKKLKFYQVENKKKIPHWKIPEKRSISSKKHEKEN